MLTEDINNWYSTESHYAKYDVISRTERSHQQSVGAQKYKRICITVLYILSHHAIFFLGHGHFNWKKGIVTTRSRWVSRGPGGSRALVVLFVVLKKYIVKSMFLIETLW